MNYNYDYLVKFAFFFNHHQLKVCIGYELNIKIVLFIVPKTYVNSFNKHFIGQNVLLLIHYFFLLNYIQLP